MLMGFVCTHTFGSPLALQYLGCLLLVPMLGEASVGTSEAEACNMRTRRLQLCLQHTRMQLCAAQKLAYTLTHTQNVNRASIRSAKMQTYM
eukprot:3605820-Amphidinium_carterae.1